MTDENCFARLAVLESQITRHERLEESFWMKMENKLDDMENKFDEKFDILEASIDALKNRRSRDNGFMAGVVFILTGVGALIGAVLAYAIK